MKFIVGMGVAVHLILMAACTTPSLAPFYEDNNLVVDQNVLGLWQNTESGERIQVIPAGRGYEFSYLPQPGCVERFNGSLFMLEGKQYLDLYPLDPHPSPGGLLDFTMVPAHILLRVASSDQTLRISILDGDWVASQLAIEGETLAHRIVERRTVLTASTSDLQRFLVKHASDAGMFPDWSEWHRSGPDIRFEPTTDNRYRPTD